MGSQGPNHRSHAGLQHGASKPTDRLPGIAKEGGSSTPLRSPRRDVVSNLEKGCRWPVDLDTHGRIHMGAITRYLFAIRARHAQRLFSTRPGMPGSVIATFFRPRHAGSSAARLADFAA
jgi:hypothetical protein